MAHGEGAATFFIECSLHAAGLNSSAETPAKLASTQIECIHARRQRWFYITGLATMKTVPRVFAYLRRYPWMAVGTLACAILSTLMLIVFPAVTKRVIDDVLGKNQPELLTPLILTAALAWARFATHYSQPLLSSNKGQWHFGLFLSLSRRE